MTHQKIQPAGVTRLLDAWQAGDEQALTEVITLLYNDLRRLAAVCLRDERGGHTLQATDLVHEAYQRLLGTTPQFQNRQHFMRTACLLMRRLLMKHARAKKALKRNPENESLHPTEAHAPDPDTLIVVNEALNSLADRDRRLHDIVEMRFFLGLTVDEIARCMELSTRTVKREWQTAKAWLALQLRNPAQEPLS